MRSILVILGYLVFILNDKGVYGATIRTPIFRSDYTYIVEGDSFYKIHRVLYNWMDAKQQCSIEGTTLWIPESEDEVKAVISMWKKKYPDITGVHVGIHDMLSEGHFETIDGRTIDNVYSNWSKGEPNNLLFSEHCVEMHVNGLMNDIFCYNNHQFICKKTAASVELNVFPASGATIGTPFFRSDYTYIVEGDSYYKIHRVLYNWMDAKQRCSIEGTILWIPESEDEVKAVISMWERKYPDITGVHVGIHDMVSEGHFETIDGRTIDNVYSKWFKGEPNNLLFSEHCVEMHVNGLMNDIFCYSNHQFICKKTAASVDWNVLCDLPDPDYIYEKNVGKCYKIHNVKQTWNKAHSICSAEQSYLVVINNQKEADFLTKLLNDSRTSETTEIVHIGIRNEDGREWITDIGTPLSDTGYTKWHNSNPKNPNKRYNCGAMTLNAKLQDIKCDEHRSFICEHDVKILSSEIDTRFGD